ncbi:MAG: DUF362 domain-containing protein [Bacteroidota bacterium]
MYNPFPYLPKKFQMMLLSLKRKKLPPGIIFFVVGSLATVWFLIRVIPKPSRAAYPCMQATAPFMSGFVLYLLSLGGAVSAFRRSGHFLTRSKYLPAFLFLIISGLFYLLSHTTLPVNSFAANTVSHRNYFTPNDPIGVAKGIFPGRVVWMWNPKATNEHCTNTSNNNGLIDPGDDAWFMEKNNNELVIDSMMMKSVMALTGSADNSEAWNLIFKYYNTDHGKGNVGYTTGEKIFIKINATSVYGGIAGGHFHADLSRTDDLTVNPFLSETNPWVVLSTLRQLINSAGVPQQMIYMGDPARNIYKEFYDLWHGEFPNVHYLGNNLIHPEVDIVALGRTPVVVTSTDKVFFSDHGTVMPDAISDKLFTIFEEMDYLINIPAMKAHSTAGITLAAKNHFGSFTREWALHLHKGLMDNYDNPTRLGYGLYRVQTDIMMHNLLSGKNLLIIVDGLYPGEDAGGVPEKWTSIPFANDWCSSLFMSLDPVAIESVCHDFLRTEYNGPTIAERRPNWFGVDDYLHQAADSSLWPDNIVYDPDNDGILIASLGVHEHWNDSLHKAYTRNLGTGNGIELFKVHEHDNGITGETDPLDIQIYPNPAIDFVKVSNPGKYLINFELTDLKGKILLTGNVKKQSVVKIELTPFENGVYILTLHDSKKQQNLKIVKQ